MTKPVKVGLIIGALLLVVAVLYFLFKPGTALSKFKAMPGKDVDGFDIESYVPSKGLEEDAQHALDIGAKSFMTRGGYTWFKSAASPVTTPTVTGGTLYVKS